MPMTREQFADYWRTLGPLDRSILADSLAIALGGGCSSCDTEKDEMCVACGSCRCDSHETCTRPA